MRQILLINLAVLVSFTLSDCNKISSRLATGYVVSEPYSGPIIDMHLHAAYLSDYGGGIPICSNEGDYSYSGWDPQTAINMANLVDCERKLQPASSDETLMLESLALLQRYNIYAVTMGTVDRVKEWKNHSPDRIIPAISFTSIHSSHYSITDFREFHQAGSLEIFAENGAQYHGRKLNDGQYDEYFALAEELDIPVGVHLGEGPTGGAHFLGGSIPSGYRAALTSPFQLEEVLIKYPKLRIYVMHYASPLVDEMIAMLYSHPQLYVDISQNNWGFPKKYFYSQLKQLIEAGFIKRIMWGSDQMAWPRAIEVAIETVQHAPFLTYQQKQDIFYFNAARFLRLSEQEINMHHRK